MSATGWRWWATRRKPLHPIAGQGFSLGLRDVMSLAETLAEAADSGEDAGGYALLSRYQQRRQNDQQATIGVTDGLIPSVRQPLWPTRLGAIWG